MRAWKKSGLFRLSLQPNATQLIGLLPPQFIFSVYLPSFNELKIEYSCAMLTVSNLAKINGILLHLNINII